MDKKRKTPIDELEAQGPGPFHVFMLYNVEPSEDTKKQTEIRMHTYPKLVKAIKNTIDQGEWTILMQLGPFDDMRSAGQVFAEWSDGTRGPGPRIAQGLVIWNKYKSKGVGIRVIDQTKDEVHRVFAQKQDISFELARAQIEASSASVIGSGGGNEDGYRDVNAMASRNRASGRTVTVREAMRTITAATKPIGNKKLAMPKMQQQQQSRGGGGSGRKKREPTKKRRKKGDVPPVQEEEAEMKGFIVTELVQGKETPKLPVGAVMTFKTRLLVRYIHTGPAADYDETTNCLPYNPYTVHWDQPPWVKELGFTLDRELLATDFFKKKKANSDDGITTIYGDDIIRDNEGNCDESEAGTIVMYKWLFFQVVFFEKLSGTRMTAMMKSTNYKPLLWLSPPQQ